MTTVKPSMIVGETAFLADGTTRQYVSAERYDALAKDFTIIRDALKAVLAHKCAEKCEECGIGQSKAWKIAKMLLKVETL